MNLIRLISGLRNWAGAGRGEQWTPPEDAYRQVEIDVLQGWYAREATRYLDGCDRDGRWAE